VTSFRGSGRTRSTGAAAPAAPRSRILKGTAMLTPTPPPGSPEEPNLVHYDAPTLELVTLLDRMTRLNDRRAAVRVLTAALLFFNGPDEPCK
jgi:hypothetical protein